MPDDVAGLEEHTLRNLVPLRLGPEKPFEIHGEMLEFSFCAFRMTARALLSFASEIRWPDQLMASASSVSDTIIRAKVRV